MELRVTKQAANLLRAKFKLTRNDKGLIRLVVVKPVNGTRQQAQITPQLVTAADQPIASASVDGTDFYVDFADEWYFSGQVVTVDVDGQELSYDFKKLAPQPSSPQPVTKPLASDATTSASSHFEELWD